jgi:uncharacterized protein (DUF885 family)
LSLEVITEPLKGLSFDTFLEESFKQLLLRDPEGLTQLGLTQTYGLRNDRLNDLSDAYLRETQALETALLALLRTYDRATLTPEQQISFDVYEYYLDEQVRGHPYLYHDYPVNHFLYSYDSTLIQLFTEAHPLTNRQDVEDYITRLTLVDDQMAQLMDGLKIREVLGVIPPKFIITMALSNLNALANGAARSLPFYTALDSKLEAVADLSSSEREDFRQQAAEAIEASVIPPFKTLVSYFEGLELTATQDAGVWKLPDGKAYYAYLLRRETSTELSAAEIHAIGLAEVERITAEIRQVFDALGYPADGELGKLMDRARQEGGFFSTNTQADKDAVVAANAALIDDMETRLSIVTDFHPKAELIVVGDKFGGYYVPGPLDGSRPGIYHATTGKPAVPKFSLATTAYHEGIPGHHFQISVAQELDLPLFRNVVTFNGYIEGWALYSEQLAWELGAYENDPYGNLGRLHMEQLRAVRLVADTGIHAMKWTREEARAYLMKALGDTGGYRAQEIDRYIVLPAQATGYKVGMLEILRLRQLAQEQLGADFNLVDFHHVVLSNGSVPLNLLDDLVTEWIK